MLPDLVQNLVLDLNDAVEGFTDGLRYMLNTKRLRIQTRLPLYLSSEYSQLRLETPLVAYPVASNSATNT